MLRPGMLHQTVCNMSQLQAIKNEIERRMKINKWDNSEGSDVAFSEDKRLLSFIESLEKEQKPEEWSEEDERMLTSVTWHLRYSVNNGDIEHTAGQLENWLKSLRPQPKQEGEPMEIKFAGKIYRVLGTKEMPGGSIGYVIEDEPWHFDCITNPDEILGGGYGIKSHGSPYPTKGTNFSQPLWKPSKEQMDALRIVKDFHTFSDWHTRNLINTLYYDLEQL